MTFVLAFLGFAALIILHELGHFTAAKAVGMRVERFSLFFPPLAGRIRRGETEYAIGTIPLGGYVKITGMSPAEEIPPEVAHRAYYRQPVWKRIVVIAAGPAVNIVLAFLILAVVYLTHVPTAATNRVGEIGKGTPAAGVLRPGDRLVAVDGKAGPHNALADRIASHRCAGKPAQGCTATTPVRVTVVRDGARRTLTMTPAYDSDAGRMRVGFTFAERELPRPGLVGAADQSVSAIWGVTSATVSTFANIFRAEERKKLSGVVGSYEATRQAISFGPAQAGFVLAVISLSLGIINLFPFLPLDGGHIFWALAEKVRGRAVSFQTMERAGFVGFALVIMLFVIGLSNDIGRLTGDGFGIR
jgi:regulator of sigma E protease